MCRVRFNLADATKLPWKNSPVKSSARTSLFSIAAVAITLGFVGAGSGAAQAKAKAKVARLGRVFDSDKLTKNVFAARRAALTRMRGVDSAAAVQALAHAYHVLDREAEPIARERRTALLTRTSLEVARFRKRLDPICVLEDLVLVRLRELQSAAAKEAMLSIVATDTQLPLSLELTLAAQIGAPASPSALQSALGRAAAPGKAVAVLRIIAALGARGGSFRAWAEAKLEHESQTLRLEAARTLAAIRARPSVPKLIHRLVSDTGRVREAIVAALETLSGVSLGISAGAWQKWWRGHVGEDGLLPPPKVGVTGAKPLRPKYPTYFGIPQEGNSILYVFDRSDSMARALASGGRRIDRARRELGKALKALPATTTFNIVSFSVRVEPWSSSMQLATPQHIAAARKWLRRLDLKGGTSSYDALERAFDLAGCGPEDRFHEFQVETVFFLSDGEPTVRTGGALRALARDDPRRILSAIRRWNALGRVTVHTIGIGLGFKGAGAFMRDLAAQNHGTFVRVR